MIDTLFATALLGDRFDKELHDFLATLMKKTREGHLCVYHPTIYDKIIPLTNGENSPIANYNNYYYLRRNFKLETTILTHLKRLASATGGIHFTPPYNLPLYEAQKKALTAAFSNKVTLISGGPGSGKTYLANALIETLLEEKQNASILFTAPTAKASFRIKNKKITQATLHHALGLQENIKEDFEPKPLAFDCIIVDECSMIDARLFSFLLSSIPSNTTVILMGDPDQLPPVEAGFVFPDFFQIEELTKVHLNTSIRCDRKGILALAKAIKEGSIATVFSLLSDPTATDICLTTLPKQLPIPFDHSTIFLTPFRTSPFGSIACNNYIESYKKPSLSSLVIVTKNDYKFHLMNGDIGFKEGDYGYFPQKVPLCFLSEYELAWTISIHKSQGSEFDHVFILLPLGSEIFGKELLYTAVTRAKLSVTIAADPDTLRALLVQSSKTSSNIANRYKEI